MTDDIDKWLNDALEQWAAQQRRRQNPHVLQLIKVLWPYGERGLWRIDAIHRVWELRKMADVRMAKKFEEAVQSVSTVTMAGQRSSSSSRKMTCSIR